ncbi:MAG: XRE family transcriptional regulator [Desulfosporosinus sp.]|nr:XRE family transcriptional regulator [Desulfosporosinus sp.]
MTFGTRLADKRKERGLSQESLAKSIGVSASFISQVETGIRNPSYSSILRISSELDNPMEYLIGGDIEGIEDSKDKIINRISKSFDPETKNKLIDYLYLIAGCKKYFDFPYFTSPIEYAQYIIRRFKLINLPIDPMEVAEHLGVHIVVSSEALNFEGVLYKCGEKPMIVLNDGNPYERRRKFTVAMLIGHLVLPWHVKDVFYREKDKRSLEIENTFEIEAREFAAALILPPIMLKEDFKNLEPGLEAFEKLAYDKYDSSLIVIGQKYVQSHSKTTALITSDKGKITRVYGGHFPYKITDQILTGSIAMGLLETSPNEREIRKGLVTADSWSMEIVSQTKIYEESLLDPKFGVIVTFLTLKHGRTSSNNA